MKRILILDTKSHQYKVREQLAEFGNFLTDNANTLADFRLKLYENDPDLILYYTSSKISIHDIIELMLNTNYTNTPVLFFKESDISEFYNHSLLLGPFLKDEASFEAIINMGLRYRDIYLECKNLEKKLAQIEEGSQSSSSGFHSFSHFSAQVIQEFKKAKRFGHPLSLMIAQVDKDELLKKEYPEDVVKKFMVSIIQSIKNAIRDTDIPMSYDENKVLILMPLTDDIGVERAIERLNANIEKTMYQDDKGNEIKTKATIGYSTLSEEITKFSEMVKEAMTAFE